MIKIFIAEKSEISSENRDFYYWITDKYIYIMLLIFPLFTGFKGYTQLTVSKYIFFVSFTVMWLVALLLGKIKTVLSKRIGRVKPVELFVFVYLIFCCISAVFSPYKSSVLLGAGRYDGLVTILLYVGIFFGASVFTRPKPSYVFAAAISMSLNCVIAVLQLLGYNPLYLFPGNYTYYDAGVKFSSVFLGTIGNADLFSAFLCLTLPLVSAYYITAKNRSLFLLPAIALSAYCLFTCGVSGGILAFGLCILLCAPFIISSGERLRRALELILMLGLALFTCISFKTLNRADGISFDFLFGKLSALVALLIILLAVLRAVLNKREFKEKTLLLLLTSLSIGAAFLSLAAVYFWNGNSGTLYELSQTLHGKPQDKFGSSRILIWRKVLKLAPEHFMLGGGPGTLPLRLDLSFSRYVQETGRTLKTTVDNAHNEYLGILVNTGAISLLAYLGALFTSLFKTAKSARHSVLCCCLACSLLCYCIQTFFGLGLFLVSPIMWLILGLLTSALKHNEN